MTESIRKLDVQAIVLACLLIWTQLSSAWAEAPKELDIVVQLPHTGEVKSAAFTPDGKYLVTGGDDSTIKLWDLRSGALIRSIVAHDSWVKSLTITADGRQIISTSGNDIKIWDIASGTLVRTFDQISRSVDTLAVTADGRFVVTDGEVWERATGTHLRSFAEMKGLISALVILPDDRHALTGRTDGTSQLWDIETGALVREFGGTRRIMGVPVAPASTYRIEAIAVTPDGRKFATGHESSVKIWDLASGMLERDLKFYEGHLSALAIAPDGKQVVAGGAGMGAWDISTGERVHNYTTGELEFVETLAISADGNHIVSGDDSGDVVFWDAATATQIRRFGAAPQSETRAVSISPDGRYFATVKVADIRIKLWDFTTGTLVRSFGGDRSYYYGLDSLAFTSDSRRIIEADELGNLIVWNIETGTEVHRFADMGKFAMTPDGRYIVSANDDNVIRLWDTETGQMSREVTGVETQISSLVVTPDGRRVVARSSDELIRVWDIASGKLIHTFNAPTPNSSFAITPDGKRIVVEYGSWGSDRGIKVWDMETGGEIANHPLDSLGRLGSLMVTPDGQRIVMTPWTGNSFELLNLSTGEVVTFSHQSAVTSIAVSPDGKRALSGSSDGTVHFWDLAAARELATLVGVGETGILLLTREGFFATDTNASATSYLKIVDGMKPYDVQQFYQAMYRPELVAELLKGDPEGKYEAAAAELNLRKILDSGPAPRLELKRTERIGGKVRVTVEINDDGGGIGKVEWRVNGVLQEGERAGTVIFEDELVKTDTRNFPLTAGDNEITVTAYNKAGLITALPIVAKIDGRGILESEKARLHILAIGIDAYAQNSLQLNYAVNDAEEFSESLKKAAEALGLFSAVSVRTLLNKDVTRAGLDKVFSEMAVTIKPEDKFVFFAAGHAKVYKDSYYFFPQDLLFGGGDAIVTQGIAQDTWQSWFSRIPARASVLIYDTCEAGQLTTAMRGTEDISTAIDLLKHATGRSILAATTAEDAAREGFQGHGVFTYALLQGLSEGDLNGDGHIEVMELGQFVERAVPELSSQRWGVAQRPRFTIQANFPIASPIAAKIGATDFIPKEPTHFAIAEVEIAAEERGDPSGMISLPRGTTVRLLKLDGNRALVARNGRRLGYVPVEALLPLQ